MEKKRTVQRKRSKKRNKPRIRFDLGVLIVLFVLGFGACFGLYMASANINDNFMQDEFGENVIYAEKTTAASPEAEAPTDAEEEIPTEAAPAVVVSNPIEAAPAVDSSYFETACLITDSTLLDMRELGKFKNENIFGNADLNAASCNSVKVSSNFGNVAVYDIIKNKKPEVLYIMLGSDLGTSEQDDMISAYTTLVTNLHAALPAMKIYVIERPPVIYDSETLTNEMVNSYNKKLLAMCDAAGVYYLNTNEVLTSDEGKLIEDCWSYEKLAINEEAIKRINTYIAEHTVS